MKKSNAWMVLGLFAAIGAFVGWQNGWQRNISFLAALATALIFLTIAIAASAGLARLWRWYFPPPPLWVRPRPASSLGDKVFVEALRERLTLVESEGRIAKWRDRSTGQMWKSVAYDFEFTEDVQYEPLDCKGGSDKNHQAHSSRL